MYTSYLINIVSLSFNETPLISFPSFNSASIAFLLTSGSCCIKYSYEISSAFSINTEPGFFLIEIENKGVLTFCVLVNFIAEYI